MTLTKKHFVDAADDVKYHRGGLYEKIVLAKEFAVLFARYNYNFDRYRFFEACDVPYECDFGVIVPEYKDD